MMARLFHQLWLLCMRWLCLLAVVGMLGLVAAAIAMVCSLLGVFAIAIWALAESAVPLSLGALDVLVGLL